MFDSIRSRILAASTAIVICSLCINTYLNYSIANKYNNSAIDSTLEAVSSSHNRAISDWVASKSRLVSALTPHVTSPDPMPLMVQTANGGNFMGIDIGYPNKIDISSVPNSVPEGYDPTTRPWYIQAVKAGKPIVTEPYVDANTKKMVVTFAAPHIENGILKGVVEGDVTMDSVIENVRSIHPTENSFGMLIDAAGNIMAHPDESLTLKPLSDIAPSLELSRLLNARSPIEYDINGSAKLLLAQPVAGTPWFTVVAMDKTEATAGMRSLLTTSLVTLLVLIVAAAVIIGVIAQRALTPLIKIRDAMDAISSGTADLTQRLPTNGKDEVSQIAGSFNRFIDKLSDVMKSIRSSSESVRVAANEIASGNQDLSSRTESAAANLQQTSAEIGRAHV